MAVVTSDGVPYHEMLPPEVEDEKAAMVASKDYVTLTELPAREAYTRDAIRWICWPTGSSAQVSEPLTSLAEHPLVLLSTH